MTVAGAKPYDARLVVIDMHVGAMRLHGPMTTVVDALRAGRGSVPGRQPTVGRSA